MGEAAANYISLDMQAHFRAQAWKVWIWTAVLVALWVAIIAIAPVLADSRLASPVYAFFSYICHQIPERSLYLAQHPMAVCSRCFGVYTGLFAGIAIYPLWRSLPDVDPIPKVWLFAALVPVSIDWSLTMFGVWDNTHLSRIITGMILGIACATFIVPALVEIVRNVTYRRDTQNPER